MRHKIGWFATLTLAFLAAWVAVGPLALAAPPHLQLRVGTGGDLEQVIKDVPPQSPATIVVEPGYYVAHNLWKPGVNIYGLPGATLSWTNTGDNIAIFDDRARGAGTNRIIWHGSITYYSDGAADAAPGNGIFVITNANTVIEANVARAYMQLADARVFGSGVFVIINCRLATLSLDYGEEIADSYGSLLYWENGETHLTFGRFVGDTGYGLWFVEPAGQPAADCYVRGQFMSVRTGVGPPNGIAFRGSNANWKAWCTIDEIANTTGYTVGMDGTGGKLYVKAQKIGNTGSAPTILNQGGALWVEADKISSGTSWFTGKSNSVSDLHVREYEDVATNISAGFRFEGGQTIIHGGRAKVWNGRGVEQVGGTNRLLGVTIDTFGTNTIATVTNCIPVVMGSGTSNLVLQSCYLRGPIATASGGALSIWGSNSAAHVLNQGSVANSNAANVHAIVTALVTNQTQLR